MNDRLKPWYSVVSPRQDLLEGRSLDTAEFAVHLDHVRDGKAHPDYQDPRRFFEKTFLTKNLCELAAQMVRRLNGDLNGTSAVFNLATQFGGGKTHALTLLYHLVKHGDAAHAWTGVDTILKTAGQARIPKGEAAIFVGTEFDSITGRGGNDGTPLRRTPWGEIAWQLGGEAAFAIVAKHDADAIAPGGDVIRRLLPEDRPCLILMDELMNYVSRFRKSGYSTQLYHFIQNLSETIRGRANAVLAISIPASELEMTAEDIQDYDRLTKMLDRLGKALVMSAEAEAAEIVRRRLFDWDLRAMGESGKVPLDRDAKATCREYAEWCIQHRDLIPGWFSVDQAQEQFEATYPFHPSVLSVFERKWRAVQSFQQTRGVLRLLGLWIANAMHAGIKSSRDPLITLGTAPLENSTFRTACFEQLGQRNLETAVTTDIAGSTNAHAIRLDNEATAEMRKIRLHQKVATAIFFESNGGRLKDKDATVPEVRLSVGGPGFEIGNIETALDALNSACYFLTVERNTYRFSLRENLNKRYADRRATIQPPAITDRLRKEIQSLMSKNSFKLTPVPFPEKSGQISDRPALTIIVADIERSMADEKKTLEFIEQMVRESGTSARTYKSAQIWLVPDSARALRDETTRLLAWEDIDADPAKLNYDEVQTAQLRENLKGAHRDLKEAIWRAYRYIILLGKDNQLRTVDLGLVTSSSASGGPVEGAVNRLLQEDEITKGISPTTLTRNWPPALPEWSLKGVRDACFASPQFPRLLYPDSIKDTIARAVSNGMLAYVCKCGDGHYEPFIFEQALNALDVEIAEETFIISRETAVAYRAKIQAEADSKQGEFPVGGGEGTTKATPVPPPDETASGRDDVPPGDPLQGDFLRKLSWTGEIPWQLWTNFYTKVLSKHAADRNLKLKVTFETTPTAGVSKEKVEETRTALRELGLGTGELKGE